MISRTRSVFFVLRDAEGRVRRVSRDAEVREEPCVIREGGAGWTPDRGLDEGDRQADWYVLSE